MRLKKFNIEYGKTIFKSFSDVSRIRILNILANRKEASFLFANMFKILILDTSEKDLNIVFPYSILNFFNLISVKYCYYKLF